jgi:hypothetical protein
MALRMSQSLGYLMVNYRDRKRYHLHDLFLLPPDRQRLATLLMSEVYTHIFSYQENFILTYYRYYQAETSAKSYFVILSIVKDFVFTCSHEILRSLRSLRMTGEGTLAEA